MYQTIKQTEEEKMAMYMKLPKKQLIEMLINCNNILETQMQIKNLNIQDIKTVEYANLINFNYEECDICKCKPNVIIKTSFGTFCQSHAKYS